MSTSDDGRVTVDLTPDQQALILVLTTHAVGGALEALRAGRYTADEDDLRRVAAAIRPREFAVAVLVLEHAPVSDEQLVEAARIQGAQAVIATLGPPRPAAVH